MAELPTPYTAGKPALKESTETLRARIPGWGADLDPKDRPAYPREQPGIETGAHWDFPERQEEKWPRERSVEHAFVTPVFGTSTPLKGASGVIRRYAYKYSEGRAAHWLLLVASAPLRPSARTTRLPRQGCSVSSPAMAWAHDSEKSAPTLAISGSIPSSSEPRGPWRPVDSPSWCSGPYGRSTHADAVSADHTLGVFL